MLPGHFLEDETSPIHLIFLLDFLSVLVRFVPLSLLLRMVERGEASRGHKLLSSDLNLRWHGLK